MKVSGENFQRSLLIRRTKIRKLILKNKSFLSAIVLQMCSNELLFLEIAWQFYLMKQDYPFTSSKFGFKMLEPNFKGQKQGVLNQDGDQRKKYWSNQEME